MQLHTDWEGSSEPGNRVKASTVCGTQDQPSCSGFPESWGCTVLAMATCLRCCGPTIFAGRPDPVAETLISEQSASLRVLDRALKRLLKDSDRGSMSQEAAYVCDGQSALRCDVCKRDRCRGRNNLGDVEAMYEVQGDQMRVLDGRNRYLMF